MPMGPMQASGIAREKLSRQGIGNEDMDQVFPVLCEMMQNDLVIVALRLLVGSTTTEFIPKYISVEGRRVWLQPDMKKQYDLPLTAEEIAWSLRNGFVSLGIGPSFDSGNNPLLDAIEVYAATREQISHWLPLTLSEMYNTQPQVKATSNTSIQAKVPVKETRLALTVAALAHILQVLRTSTDVTPEARETVRYLVQDTALEDGYKTRQPLATLLNYIEPDSFRRKRILDEGTLTGVLKALHSANTVVMEALAKAEDGSSLSADAKDLERNDSHMRERWNNVRQMMKSCLRASTAVAGERPENYKIILEETLAAEAQDCSIAVAADSIFKKALENEFKCQDLVPDLVELCLTEWMIFFGRGEAPKDGFASFGVLAESGSSDDELVNECCESILSFWAQHLSKADPVVSYQCDGCSLFPITVARYSLPEGGSMLGQDADIDLCNDCFTVARDFAAQNRYDGRVNVKIRGKTVGKTHKA